MLGVMKPIFGVSLSLPVTSLFVMGLVGCMNYAENDRRLVFRSDGTHITQATPDSNDKFIYVAIGMKRLARYSNDPVQAANEESRRLVDELHLCPSGYALRMRPETRTGDYGFGWTIVCN